MMCRVYVYNNTSAGSEVSGDGMGQRSDPCESGVSGLVRLCRRLKLVS